MVPFGTNRAELPSVRSAVTGVSRGVVQVVKLLLPSAVHGIAYTWVFPSAVMPT
jgi:hypothetical protein